MIRIFITIDGSHFGLASQGEPKDEIEKEVFDASWEAAREIKRWYLDKRTIESLKAQGVDWTE